MQNSFFAPNPKPMGSETSILIEVMRLRDEGLNNYYRPPLKGSIRVTIRDLEGYYNMGA